MKRSVGASVGFIVKVGLAAVIFILFFKWLASKVNVPGLSAAAQAV
jgi:hypothetical protein